MARKCKGTQPRQHREYLAFIRNHPEMGHLPEYIIGAGDRQMRLLEATYADLVAYQAFIKRRIDRRLRLAGAEEADGHSN